MFSEEMEAVEVTEDLSDNLRVKCRSAGLGFLVS